MYALQNIPKRIYSAMIAGPFLWAAIDALPQSHILSTKSHNAFPEGITWEFKSFLKEVSVVLIEVHPDFKKRPLILVTRGVTAILILSLGAAFENV